MAIGTVTTAARLYSAASRNVEKKEEPKKSAFSSREEKVELSSKAGSSETLKLAMIIATTPDIRIDKIMELKAQIGNGSYPVNSKLDDAVQKMIDENALGFSSLV